MGPGDEATTKTQAAMGVGAVLVVWALAVYLARPRQFADAVAGGDHSAADRAIADAVSLRDAFAFALPAGLIAITALLAAEGARP